MKIAKKKVLHWRNRKSQNLITTHRLNLLQANKATHQKFKENFDFTCSLPTCYKYKPFISALQQNKKKNPVFVSHAKTLISF